MKKIKIIKVVTIVTIVTILSLKITLKVVSLEYTSKAISLNEAFEIAYNEAKKWEENAELFTLSSVDNEDMTKEDDGHDGNRRFWNFTFIVPREEKQLIISIHDKKITNKLSEKGPAINSEFIKKEEINITSKEALEETMKYFDVNAGQGWAGGYHFTLNKQDNIVVLKVICSDKDGYFSNFLFNSTTKEMISALHKVPIGGGVLKNKNYIKLNNGNQVSGLDITMSPNFENDETMIASYIVDPYKSNMALVASITKDGGTTWEDLNIKDYFTKIVFSDNFNIDKSIYAIAGNNLIRTNNYGIEWQDVFTMKSQILNINLYKEKILLNCENSLYLSKDRGVSWKKLDTPGQVNLDTINSNGDIYIYSNNRIFREENGSWDELEISIPGDIKGVKFSNDNLIFYSENSINLFNLKSSELSTIDNLEDVDNVFLINSGNLYYSLGDKSLINLTRSNDLWIAKNVDINIKGKLLNLNIKESTGDLYLCVDSEGKWEKMERRK